MIDKYTIDITPSFRIWQISTKVININIKQWGRQYAPLSNMSYLVIICPTSEKKLTKIKIR